MQAECSPQPFRYTPGLFSGAGYLPEGAGHRMTPGVLCRPGV
nr:MAG TPA: hypothetical protein [Caudoviricetes sp.]